MSATQATSYVRLIFERLIMFDLQTFWVSSTMFNYRTQSKSIEQLQFDWVRLPNVPLTAPKGELAHSLLLRWYIIA